MRFGNVLIPVNGANYCIAPTMNAMVITQGVPSIVKYTSFILTVLRYLSYWCYVNSDCLKNIQFFMNEGKTKNK